jgi:hypothetical protein
MYKYKKLACEYARANGKGGASTENQIKHIHVKKKTTIG